MAPSEDDVRRQLDRLLASAGFANAGRMSRFLKFVVEKTLAGEAERLKEYVIGVEVFDRDADYDPRVDAIVRVEAARLRTKLAEYYAGEGRDDAVVLSLPKGGYAPVIKLEQRPARNRARSNRRAAASRRRGGARPSRRRRSRRWLLGAALAGWPRAGRRGLGAMEAPGPATLGARRCASPCCRSRPIPTTPAPKPRPSRCG